MSPIELIHGMSRIVDREEANVTWQTLNGTVGNDNCLFKPIPGILSRSLSPSWFSQYRLEGGIIFENKNGFLFSLTQLVGESKNNENENAFLFFVFALPIGPFLRTLFMVDAHECPHTKISILRFRFSCAIRSGLRTLFMVKAHECPHTKISILRFEVKNAKKNWLHFGQTLVSLHSQSSFQEGPIGASIGSVNPLETMSIATIESEDQLVLSVMKFHITFSARTCIFFLMLVGVAMCSNSYLMNHTCSPPQSQGGTGYCGPAYCSHASSINNASGCIFKSATFNYPTLLAKTQTKTCTQSTDSRCNSAALAALVIGQGIKAAYCNDAFLIIISDGTPGFQTNLESIKNPPGSVDSDGVTCVTRYVNPTYMTVKIPLYPTMLSTSDPSINNVNNKSFPNGAGDSDASYMSATIRNTGATYGLPTRGNQRCPDIKPTHLMFGLFVSDC